MAVCARHPATMASAAYRQNFELIDWSGFKPSPRRAPMPIARSELGFPLILRDEISPGKSQLDGKIYDSRSALLASYREYEARTGKEVEIVGDQVHHVMADNAKAEVADEKAIEKAIVKAVEKHGL